LCHLQRRVVDAVAGEQVAKDPLLGFDGARVETQFHPSRNVLLGLDLYPGIREQQALLARRRFGRQREGLAAFDLTAARALVGPDAERELARVDSRVGGGVGRNRDQRGAARELVRWGRESQHAAEIVLDDLLVEDHLERSPPAPQRSMVPSESQNPSPFTSVQSASRKRLVFASRSSRSVPTP
jgi:hypothetical protein